MTVEAGTDSLRWIRADNPGPFTLDGTRTYIVGQRQVAVIDPGPDMDSHVRAVALAVADADEVTVLLSHGHGDHSDGVSALMELLPGARLVGHGHVDCEPVVPPTAPTAAEGTEGAAESGRLTREVGSEGVTGQDGARGVAVAVTDAGPVYAIPTPGHTRDHLCFHWPAARTLFAADMVLGQGDTTWVAEYPECVADYLESLDRLEALDLTRVFSAHGPVIKEVPKVWHRYRSHRLSRIDSTRAALIAEGVSAAEAAGPGRVDGFLDRIYGGTIPDGLRSAARDSLRAVLHHLNTHG